jgi:hypothetical protein
MSESKTFRVIISIGSGANLKKRSEVDYDDLQSAYKFASGWFKNQYDWALNGFKINVSIIPMEKLEDFP